MFSPSSGIAIVALSAALLAAAEMHAVPEAAEPHKKYASEEEEEAAAERRLRGNPATLPQALYLDAKEHFADGDLAGSRRSLDSSLASGGPSAERMHLLGLLALARKDSAAALPAFEKGWSLGDDETNFAAMVALKSARGPLPVDFLRRSLERYRAHPSAVAAMYEACAGRGKDAAQLAFCGELTSKAHREWWPSSADWKLRHARVLRDLGRKKELKPILLEALDLLDSRPDAAAGNGSVPEARKEILALLAYAGQA